LTHAVGPAYGDPVFPGVSESNACPRCATPASVVTAVTVAALGADPRSVLVTRQCATPGCHHKYVVLKTEGELTAEERDHWRNP
jgi:hypothetical protein